MTTYLHGYYSPRSVLSVSAWVRYLSGERKSQKQWLYEHLGGMIGAGIAFHTAFAVFGFGQLFEFRIEGMLAVVPWVLPAMTGIPATIIWTRHYQKKFGELPALNQGHS